MGFSDFANGWVPGSAPDSCRKPSSSYATLQDDSLFFQINLTFNGTPPRGLEPLEGITLPVGNDRMKIQASVCAINDYLQNHIVQILCNLTQQCQGLVRDIRAFSTQFSVVFQTTATLQCHRQITAGHNYELKEIGLQIINFTRQWVESFTNTTTICNS